VSGRGQKRISEDVLKGKELTIKAINGKIM
jgi:hypothetical protein